MSEISSDHSSGRPAGHPEAPSAPLSGAGRLTDIHGRSVRYLRLSLTDRCNFNCIYCSSGDSRAKFISHSNILRYEEILDLADLMVARGVEKIRLTGGEPFMRKGIMNFLERLRLRQPGLIISLTSNGSLTRRHLKDIKEIGIKSINLSLDSLDPKRFAAITGSDMFPEVRKTIDAALELGLGLKLNAVALRNYNREELKDFLAFATQYPVEVRFIEYMPMGGNEPWLDSNFWPAENILTDANRFADLEPVQRNDPGSGPARIFKIKGGRGRFGLITPLSNHFCNQCNRLRITADGQLRTCLFSEREYRLRQLLRHPKLGIQYVDRLLNLATRHKPIGFELLEARKSGRLTGRKMNAIGG